jgi:hypothetical protein
MIDVFEPMSPDAQRDQRAAYRAFVIERDGTADFEQRTLARRELSTQRFTRPPARIRELDRQLFDAQYAQYDAKHKTPVEMTLLLALLKINASEAYGVKLAYDNAKKRALASEDDLELRLLIEETYHTRILLSAANAYGMDVTPPNTPPGALGLLIASIATTPKFVARPLTMAAEILGTLLFLNLLHCTRSELAHDAELRDAFEERIIEVLVDEIGHIGWNRMTSGPLALAQTRLILPRVALSLGNAMPEVAALAVMPDNPEGLILALRDSPRLPEAVRKQAFFCSA